MASVTESETGKRDGTGLLLAGWILGLIGLILGSFFFLILLATLIFAFIPILGFVGFIMTIVAWSKAKDGKDPGMLGILGGIFMLIGATTFIGGILAIIGGAQAS